MRNVAESVEVVTVNADWPYGKKERYCTIHCTAPCTQENYA